VDVERIAVVGCIGAGKSTVARELGRRLGIEVFHLDRYWWKPGRYRVTGAATAATSTMAPDEYRRLEAAIVAGERWIVDGDAANKDLRLSRADTVVFLDLPRWRCLSGLLKRHLTGGYDYPDGVKGSLRWVLFLTRWVWTTWPSRRRPSLLAAIAEHASAAEVVHVTSRREVRSFLDAVPSE
jgi:adenylate kinase family enzyme